MIYNANRITHDCLDNQLQAIRRHFTENASSPCSPQHRVQDSDYNPVRSLPIVRVNSLPKQLPSRKISSKSDLSFHSKLSSRSTDHNHRILSVLVSGDNQLCCMKCAIISNAAAVRICSSFITWPSRRQGRIVQLSWQVDDEWKGQGHVTVSADRCVLTMTNRWIVHQTRPKCCSTNNRILKTCKVKISNMSQGQHITDRPPVRSVSCPA